MGILVTIFESIKSLGKVVTGISGILKSRKQRKKANELYQAKHKTDNYFDKYHPD